MPTWAKYTAAIVLGWLFGNGTLTLEGLAHAFQAFVNALT